MKIYEESTFSKISGKTNPLMKGFYENCRFEQCDLSECDLSECIFSECSFVDCNLSLVNLTHSAFQNTLFRNCKMLGIQFTNCDDTRLSFRFEYCVLNHSSFYKTSVKTTYFVHTQLQEVDFTECDLSQSVFDHCDMLRSVFENSNLEKADFRTAINYTIDPELNKIRKAKFSVYGLSGLLSKYGIQIEDNPV